MIKLSPCSSIRGHSFFVRLWDYSSSEALDIDDEWMRYQPGNMMVEIPPVGFLKRHTKLKDK